MIVTNLLAETFPQPVAYRVKKHHTNVFRSFSTSKNVSTKHCVDRCMNGINVSCLLALVCTANHFWVNRGRRRMWRHWTYELLLRNTACRPLLSGGRPRKHYKLSTFRTCSTGICFSRSAAQLWPFAASGVHVGGKSRLLRTQAVVRCTSRLHRMRDGDGMVSPKRCCLSSRICGVLTQKNIDARKESPTIKD